MAGTNRTNRAPYDPPPADAPLERQQRPWAEVDAGTEHHGTTAQERAEHHNLRTRKAFSLLKRVVALEYAERDEPCPAKVRLVLELDLGLPEPDGPPEASREYCSAGEQLAALCGGLGLLLKRVPSEGEDFRLLTREQQEWLEKILEISSGRRCDTNSNARVGPGAARQA